MGRGGGQGGKAETGSKGLDPGDTGPTSGSGDQGSKSGAVAGGSDPGMGSSGTKAAMALLAEIMFNNYDNGRTTHLNGNIRAELGLILERLSGVLTILVTAAPVRVENASGNNNARVTSVETSHPIKFPIYHGKAGGSQGFL